MSLRNVVGIGLVCAGSLCAQGRPVDWPSYGGDAQRSGWEKSDSRITKDNIKDFQLVLKRKLSGRSSVLTAPLIVGNLISYRGFKELALVSSEAGDLWAIDADLDRVFWERRLNTEASRKNACEGVVTIPALVPPTVFRPRPTGPIPRPVGSSLGGGFGSARPLFMVSADGKLHRINTSDGSDQQPPVDFLPPGSRAAALTIADGVIYAAAQAGCGKKATSTVSAIDLTKPGSAAVKQDMTGVVSHGLGGFAVGSDGTVYVQNSSGAVSSMTAGELKPKQSFTPEVTGKNVDSRVTPVVFEFKGRDLIATAGPDGRIYLLDSDTLGGDDHKSFLHRTEPLASAGGGVWGGLSTWQDAAGVRWIAAPVWGAITLGALAPKGAITNGALVAFQVEEHDGKPVLTPTWVSPNMSAPEPAVVTGGYVFVLSAGDFNAKLRARAGSHATLFVLDAATGKQVYSTGNQVTVPANLTGVTLANGRVYFTTTDSTLYAFGIPLER